jgi:response regulator of citrate/malate metabolism
MSNTPNKVLNCIIIDKNQVARSTFARFFHKMDHFSLSGSFNNINNALTECQETVDLVLLDLDLEDAHELNAIPQIPGEPLFIFTSPKKKDAIAAFEYNAIDFLKKPVDYARFKKALDKVLEHKNYISDQTEWSELQGADNKQLNWNIIQLLLTRSNRLTHQIFEFANQTEQESVRSQMAKTASLQLRTNQQMARVLDHDYAYFTATSMIAIETVMQDAISELMWYAQKKGIKILYSTNSLSGTTPANPEILSLVLTQILAIMIRFAPTESEINISVQVMHQELSICFQSGGLTIDDHDMNKIDNAIDALNSTDFNSFKYNSEGVLISYFLERMDAEVYTECTVEQGVSIHLSFDGRD